MPVPRPIYRILASTRLRKKEKARFLAFYSMAWGMGHGAREEGRGKRGMGLGKREEGRGKLC
jgi:hypothetical protein